MKFSVSSSALLSLLATTGKVISNKNTLPILDYFLMELSGNELKVTTSDLETTLIGSITVDSVESEGTIAAPAKLMLDSLKEFSELPLTIDVNDKNWEITINWKSGSLSIPGASAVSYPAVPQLSAEKKELSMDVDTLVNGINKTIFATADDELRPEMNGIYIGMVTIWGSQVKAENINAQQAKAYGKFLANRYKNSPNIIWVMGGDIQGDIHPEVWESLATSIKSIDHNHLMTYHPRGRYTSAKWWSKAKWLDFHTFQSGHRKYGQRMGNKDYPIPDNTEEDNWMYVDSTWAYKPIKPVLDAEPSYEDIPKGLHDPNEERWQDYDVRRYAYWSVFAGSCGHTYGHNAIMQMLKPGYPTSYGSDGAEKPWYVALNDPGFNQMKHLKNLMLSLPYFERVPDQSIIAGENGERYNRLLATRGNDYLLVYNYNCVPMKLDLRKVSGSRKNVWWMDAANGQLEYIGEFDNKIITFAPQKATRGISDGVFIAIDASKDYLKKDQKMIEDQSLAGKKRDLNE